MRHPLSSVTAARQDLIHKAAGWMLRETGKRDMPALKNFLRRYQHRMPRTMLRYAIERFPKKERQAYLYRYPPAVNSLKNKE